MLKKLLLIVLLPAVFLVAGCELSSTPTGQAGDMGSAQALMPSINGFNSYSADNIQSAISLATGGASAATGNLLGTLAVARIDAMINCYKGVGAVDARVYVSNDLLSSQTVGALAVVNQSRLQQNLLACATNPGGAMGAQTAGQPQPCLGSGTIRYNGEEIAYIYGATDQSLCQRFVSHFTALDQR
jgi:hypothetical protein